VLLPKLLCSGPLNAQVWAAISKPIDVAHGNRIALIAIMPIAVTLPLRLPESFPDVVLADNRVIARE
jgi:hypothetical protein